MGGRTADESRYGGGHSSLSDDGNGNILVAPGKQLLRQGAVDLSAPFIAHADNTDSGLDIESQGASIVRNAAYVLRGINGYLDCYGRLAMRDRFSAAPSAIQSITSAADVILINGAHIQLSASAYFVMTGVLSAGAPGERALIENVGSSVIDLPDGVINLQTNGGATISLGAGDSVKIAYSSSLGAWAQSGTKQSI